ncbi:hypothetical protein TRVA0_008S00848 [Trichomonascus vanleenenianus]|uniref:uncharacterized protein n=1 Tax=Trichomonascus vanleenenianus TaxID=2268995 RepID=UPI003ECAD9E9
MPGRLVGSIGGTRGLLALPPELIDIVLEYLSSESVSDGLYSYPTVMNMFRLSHVCRALREYLEIRLWQKIYIYNGIHSSRIIDDRGLVIGDSTARQFLDSCPEYILMHITTIVVKEYTVLGDPLRRVLDLVAQSPAIRKVSITRISVNLDAYSPLADFVRDMARRKVTIGIHIEILDDCFKLDSLYTGASSLCIEGSSMPMFLPACLQKLKLAVRSMRAETLGGLLSKCPHLVDLSVSMRHVFNPNNVQWIPDSVRRLTLEDYGSIDAGRRNGDWTPVDCMADTLEVTGTLGYNLRGLRFPELRELRLVDPDMFLVREGDTLPFAVSLGRMLERSFKVDKLAYAFGTVRFSELVPAHICATIKTFDYRWYTIDGVAPPMLSALSLCPNLETIEVCCAYETTEDMIMLLVQTLLEQENANVSVEMMQRESNYLRQKCSSSTKRVVECMGGCHSLRHVYHIEAI